MLNIIKAYAVKNLCYIAARKMTPKGIVVHSTGVNNPNLKRYVDCPQEVGTNTNGNHWNNPKPDGRQVCVHAFIGYDKNKSVRVAEILPLNICCWGVGSGSKGSYNYDPPYIQFEICEDALSDENYYRQAFSLAEEYCAQLCAEYGLAVDSIVGHAEAYRKGYGSNHSDPEHWMKKFGENMDDFRNSVSEILKSKDVISENTKETVAKSPDATQQLHKGDLVSIADGAVYYNDAVVPAWVIKQNWYVKSEPVGDRVVIDRNEAGTSSICSPISSKYLTAVKSTASASESSACPYKVKITADSLNIRKSFGTDNAVVGCITDKGVYTIVEERAGVGASLWGRLKSGVGWISLDYAKKI